MAGNPLRELERFGQSFWLDYIQRDLLNSDEFRRLLEDDGLRGMTSNPTIFDKAISRSNHYDRQLEEMARKGKGADDIYDALVFEDIRMAADALRQLYDQSSGRSGYISCEVSPLLAHDTDATIAEARRIFAALDRPNLMVKVPGTPEGIPAIEQLTAEGRNINVTLMFSMRHYETVAEAFIRGLEKRAQKGLPLDRVASVASVFVSRIDTLVDKRLDEQFPAASDQGIAALRGKAGIANIKLIYQRFKEYFHGQRFKPLVEKGARAQRPLWGSTGTKNPAYSDVMYVDNLIGPDTINTIPPATIDAFRDHGKPRCSIEEGLNDAYEAVRRLAGLGIDLDAVGDQLQSEGVDAFAQSYKQLLGHIEERRASLMA
jgi:transaldolase